MAYLLILFLIALTGYIFCQVDQQESKKLAWHARKGGLYYRYAAAGAIFTLLGFFVYRLVYFLRPDAMAEAAHWLATPLNQAINESWPSIHLFLGTALVSIASAIILAVVRNKSRTKKGNSHTIYREVEETEDAFSRVMLVAMENRLTVLITLDDNKVYIGHPLEFYSPYLEHTWFQILPVMSGYRTPKRKTLKLTTDYTASIHESFTKRVDELKKESVPPRLDDFSQTIRVDRVLYFTIFDIPHFLHTVNAEDAP